MMNPDMVFSADPQHGLVARSGWEKEEARTVLRDLGWEWAEELHALVPPDDVPEIDAAVQAVAELHLHGHLTGYAVGPYGTTRLTLTRAEQVFTKLVTRDAAEVQPLETGQEVQQTASRQRLGYGRNATTMETFPAETPDGPAI